MASYRICLTVGMLALGGLILVTRADEPSPEETKNWLRAKDFVRAHEARIRPLERQAALAWWNANVSGKDEDFKAKEEAQNRLDTALADPERFKELKAIKAGPLALLSSEKRQIELLYDLYERRKQK